MKLAEPAQYFWGVEDVMNALDVSKPTAYKIMEESGCLAPLNRRKRVRYLPRLSLALTARG